MTVLYTASRNEYILFCYVSICKHLIFGSIGVDILFLSINIAIFKSSNLMNTGNLLHTKISIKVLWVHCENKYLKNTSWNMVSLIVNNQVKIHSNLDWLLDPPSLQNTCIRDETPPSNGFGSHWWICYLLHFILAWMRLW